MVRVFLFSFFRGLCGAGVVLGGRAVFLAVLCVLVCGGSWSLVGLGWCCLRLCGAWWLVVGWGWEHLADCPEKNDFWVGEIIFLKLESGDCWDLLGFLLLRCRLLLGGLPGKKWFLGRENH